MKKNNKGFLMVETVVVSTFVMFVLIILYIQFSSLLINYKKSYTYNTVSNIYNLSAIKDYLIENQGEDGSSLNAQLSETTPYIVIYSNGNCNKDIALSNIDFCNEVAKAGDFETIIYTNSDVTKLKDIIKNTDDAIFTQGFKNFITKINNIDNKNRLIAKFVDNHSETDDKTHYTYATITYGVNNNEK